MGRHYTALGKARSRRDCDLRVRSARKKTKKRSNSGSRVNKKNWLFIGHPDAGQRSAILYSLIVSCQRHGKNPLAYLQDLLTRLPRMTNRDDLRALTPRMWQPATS